MQHDEFAIGESFWCSGRQWRCTDRGTRTIVAMRIDQVDVGSTNPELRRTLGRAEAEAEGWFDGPPYAVSEVVFDEDFLPACSLEPDGGMPSEPDVTSSSEEWPNTAANIAQARALREQARAGGLRFEAYLPPELAEWLLGLIARGVFIDPSEAVFVMLGEQQELEPHADLREELVRRSCQDTLDDPRSGISQEEMKERMEKLLALPRQPPAVWQG
jgi:antitoxin ParD1/3/4